MAIINDGGILMRNAIADIITHAQYGSGTTSVAVTDTGLETPISASQKTVTVTKSGFSITAVHELTSTEANGNALAEFELSSSTTSPLTRTKFTPFDKTNSKELISTSIIYLEFN